MKYTEFYELTAVLDTLTSRKDTIVEKDRSTRLTEKYSYYYINSFKRLFTKTKMFGEDEFIYRFRLINEDEYQISVNKDGSLNLYRNDKPISLNVFKRGLKQFDAEVRYIDNLLWSQTAK